jgi:hypothetical protein
MRYLFIILTLITTPAFAAKVTPEMVEKEIYIHSAKSAKKKYFKCEEPFTAYEHVASANKQWLALAVEIMPYTSGCENRLMRDAMARAMVEIPTMVLPYVNSKPELTAAKICISPIALEANADKSAKYLNTLESALKKVTGDLFKDQLEACLSQLEAARKSIKE